MSMNLISNRSYWHNNSLSARLLQFRARGNVNIRNCGLEPLLHASSGVVFLAFPLILGALAGLSDPSCVTGLPADELGTMAAATKLPVILYQ